MTYVSTNPAGDDRRERGIARARLEEARRQRATEEQRQHVLRCGVQSHLHPMQAPDGTRCLVATADIATREAGGWLRLMAVERRGVRKLILRAERADAMRDGWTPTDVRAGEV